jgi:iron complex transport system substrate-binding protein
MESVKMFIFLFLFVPSVVFAESFVDATGYELEIETPPNRIISLVPSITEELFSLNVQQNIIGVTVFCDHPKEATEKEKVGTFLEPNVEKILSLKPDIIFATKEGHNKDVIDRLKSFGVVVFVFDECKDFNDISSQYKLLAKIVGKEEESEETLKHLRNRINSIVSELESVNKKRIFWEVGASPLVSVGGETFVNNIIVLAGGINIAGASNIRYPRYSREDVIRQNPDVIILVTMGDVTAEELKNWQSYKYIEAVKQGKIYIVDGHKFCSPTPHMFTEALEELKGLIHDEKK